MTPRTTRGAATGVLLLALAPLITGCGDSDASPADPSGTDGLTVVATTDVWGDIAQQVGGDAVSVTSIISDPAQDPHSFEASTETLLAVSKADLIIENGGGYDDFMERMIGSSGSSAPVLNAVDISGKTAPAGGELNEHVWYDLPTAALVADQIADALGKADPDRAAAFEANAEAFDAKIDTLVNREQALKTTVAGDEIGITEPVPLWMTGALGLVDATPAAFSEAVEEGDDVPVAVLKQTLDLFRDGEVDALVYNEQTTGPVTEQVEAAASKADIPIVPVTETLPDGTDYLTWMGDNLTALQQALVRS